MFKPFLLFLDISTGELFIIVLAIFILFGPKRIPEMARKLGKFINDIKRASENITKEIKEETDIVKKDVNVLKDINEIENKNDMKDKEKK